MQVCQAQQQYLSTSQSTWESYRVKLIFSGRIITWNIKNIKHTNIPTLNTSKNAEQHKVSQSQTEPHYQEYKSNNSDTLSIEEQS